MRPVNISTLREQFVQKPGNDQIAEYVQERNVRSSFPYHQEITVRIKYVGQQGQKDDRQEGTPLEIGKERKILPVLNNVFYQEKGNNSGKQPAENVPYVWSLKRFQGMILFDGLSKIIAMNPIGKHLKAKPIDQTSLQLLVYFC